MDWGGVCTFRAATVIAVMILPLVTLVRPAFFIFFGINMAVQCFACGNIGMRMAKTANDRGIACVMAATLACASPGWALLAGVAAWAMLEGTEVYHEWKEGKNRAEEAAGMPIAPQDRMGC